MKPILVGSIIVLNISCASLNTRNEVRLRNEVMNTVVEFSGWVNDQYLEGGMESETLAYINSWISMVLRVTTSPQGKSAKQWEGQARLDWIKIRSLCGPYDKLNASVIKIDRLLQ